MHLHTVMPDGVFAIPAPDKKRASFIALPPPKTKEVERLLARVVKRVTRCMTRYFQGTQRPRRFGRDGRARRGLDGVSLGRLTKAADGTVRYTMKRVIRGKQELVLTGFLGEDRRPAPCLSLRCLPSTPAVEEAFNSAYPFSK